MQSHAKFLKILVWSIMMSTNAIVIYNIVSVFEVWCGIHWSNAHGINVQLILQVTKLIMNSCITTHVHNMQTMHIIKNQF